MAFGIAVDAKRVPGCKKVTVCVYSLIKRENASALLHFPILMKKVIVLPVLQAANAMKRVVSVVSHIPTEKPILIVKRIYLLVLVSSELV